MKRPRTFSTLLVACMVLATSAAAQGSLSKHDTKLPIEITSRDLEVRQQEQIAIFTGNVVAQQGDMLLRADRLLVRYTEDEAQAAAQGNKITRIDAEGNVFLTSPTETAQGRTGVYDVINEVVTLVGDVVVTQADNVIKGERMVLDLATGRSHMQSAPGTTDGRVKMIFEPAKKSE
jgi:lipopolysaccharide export system protein LptA